MASSKDILKADEVARMEAGAKAEAPMKEARIARARNIVGFVFYIDCGDILLTSILDPFDTS